MPASKGIREISHIHYVTAVTLAFSNSLNRHFHQNIVPANGNMYQSIVELIFINPIITIFNLSIRPSRSLRLHCAFLQPDTSSLDHQISRPKAILGESEESLSCRPQNRQPLRSRYCGYCCRSLQLHSCLLIEVVYPASSD